MKPLLVFSDLHGCFHTFERLLAKCPKDRQIILLGDLVDRGLRSRQMVEYAINNEIPTCYGNHEDLCLAYSAHAKLGYKAKCARFYDYDVWRYNGGEITLANWLPDQTEWRKGLPHNVLDWMAALPAYIIPDASPDENGKKLLLSHTGYGLEADEDGWLNALWGRYPDDGEFPDDNYFRVFGHTKTDKVEITPTHVNIDTGAAYSGHHIMTAFLWPEKKIIQQEYDESPL